MALAQFNGLVVLKFDDTVSGNFQASPTITVRIPGSLALATLFANEAGDPLSNPFEGNENGGFTFWVESGNYHIITNEGQTDADQLLNVPISAGGGGEAIEVEYDNTSSGLGATNVQDAIDEVDSNVDGNTSAIGSLNTDLTNHINDATDAHDATAISFDSASVPATTASETQTAIADSFNLIDTLVSGLSFQGGWNADTNTPDLTLLSPAQGDFWLVTIAGNTDLSGGTPDPGGDPLNSWGVNDRAIYDAIAGQNGYVGWIRLPFSGTVTNASTVLFNDVNYVAEFPTDPTPPQEVQSALDKGWPLFDSIQTQLDGAIFTASGGLEKNAQDVKITDANQTILSNADISQAGKVDQDAITNWDTVNYNRFGYSSGLPSSPNPSTASGGFVSSSLGRGVQIVADLQSLTTGALYYRTGFNGAYGNWFEIFSSQTRTSAEANTILDNADISQAGKVDQDAIIDWDTVNYNRFGYSSGLPSSPNPSTASGGFVSSSLGRGVQIVADLQSLTTGALYYRTGFNGAYGNWSQIFSSQRNNSTSGDLTAFDGTAAVAQPRIAATGQTTAYDLIELLLNMVDTLETEKDSLQTQINDLSTRLDNAGIP